jgi:uncharacterized membrane protein
VTFASAILVALAPMLSYFGLDVLVLRGAFFSSVIGADVL